MPDIKALQRIILDHVSRENYRPVKPKIIYKKIDLPDVELRDVKRAIKALIKSKTLAWGPQHLVLKAVKKKKAESTPDGRKLRDNEVLGLFRKAAGGYGFVTPDPVPGEAKSVDIFIPASKVHDAADGDRVKVRVSKPRPAKSYGKKNRRKIAGDSGEVRVSGRIVDVIQRRTNQFVGTYLENAGYGFVQVDGNVFETTILVGDAGAKNCRVGDKVVIEMVSFPSNFDEGEGVIIQVLGPRGEPGVDTQTIIHEFGLPGPFSEKVLIDARRQAEQFDDDEIPKERTDFTNDTVITIDPKTARDFDDAISLEQLENGHWRLGVHIADVSHFVKPGTELDNEAYARATSVYLPDKVIPMIPEIISNNLASLQPKRNRYCMTAVIEFTADGAPVATDLHRGVICSAHRFNYEEIDEYLADDKPWKERLEPRVFKLVRRMHTLAMILRDRRMKRGAIELSLPEVKIELDDDGRACGAKTVEHTESHQIIEEFMLAANEAVARELSDRGLYLIRRIHDSPAPTKLRDLNSFIQAVGIQASSLQDRFEIKRVIEEAKGRPEEHAVHFAVLRAMQKAVYSPREIGHYALASNEYCHFTSPIRRYPDLIIHRMVASLIEGKKPASDFDHLTRLGNHCSQLEQRAEQAERSLIKLKLLNLLAEQVDREFSAVVTGVESYGLFAQLMELPADGLISIEGLPNDKYQFDKSTRTLAGFRSGNIFRMGDRVRVKIDRVDPDARELELKLVAHQPTSRPAKKLKSKPQKSKPGKKSSGRKTSTSKRGTGSVSALERNARSAGVKKSKKKKTKKKSATRSANPKKSKSTKKKKAKSGKAIAKGPAKRKSKAAAAKRKKSKTRKHSKGKRK